MPGTAQGRAEHQPCFQRLIDATLTHSNAHYMLITTETLLLFNFFTPHFALDYVPLVNIRHGYQQEKN